MTRPTRHRLLRVRGTLTGAALTVLWACSSDPSENPNGARAKIVGLGINAAVIAGELTFTPVTGGVTIAGELRGLAAGSEHGFHLHENGDCSDPTGITARGHWNPGMHEHGAPASPTSHLGDLGNITVGPNGVATISVRKAGVTIGDSGPTDVVGRAVIVHASRDDLTTDPTGMAGDRVACGVVEN